MRRLSAGPLRIATVDAVRMKRKGDVLAFTSPSFFILNDTYKTSKIPPNRSSIVQLATAADKEYNIKAALGLFIGHIPILMRCASVAIRMLIQLALSLLFHPI